jgi:hypothetical protein
MEKMDYFGLFSIGANGQPILLLLSQNRAGGCRLRRILFLG